MKKTLFIFFALVSFTFYSKAQDKAKAIYFEKFAEGNYLILEENYPQALKSFLQAYEIDSSNANINYKIGFCYIKTEATKSKAAKYLEKAVMNTTKIYNEDSKEEKKAPINAFYYYGLSLHLNYKFDEAIINYNKFKLFLSPSKNAPLIKDVDRMIEISNNAKQLVANPVNYTIKNLGDSINSPYPDYSSVISADEKTIIFTSRRPGSTGGDLTFEGDFFEDIYISHKLNDSTWEKAKQISPNINTDEHEASVGLSADGQTLLIYRNANNGDIFESTLEGNEWTVPMPLLGNINTSHWEPSACLTPDGNTIYFVSDRPGGLGGRDIWTSVKLPNGKWSKAVNVGAPINSEYDEDSPFISSENVLYFSSNGHNTMGGFDIFSSKKTENVWSEPKNIGYPINTPDNDLFYSVSPDGRRGYFTSSLRPGGYGDKDIYMSLSNEPKKIVESVVLIKGKVIPAVGDSLPSDIDISALNNESGLNYVSSVLMRDGSFLFILPPNTRFSVSYQQNEKEFFTEEWGPYNGEYKEIKKEFYLKHTKKGEPLIFEKFTTSDSTSNKSLEINKKKDNEQTAPLVENGTINKEEKIDPITKTTEINNEKKKVAVTTPQNKTEGNKTKPTNNDKSKSSEPSVKNAENILNAIKTQNENTISADGVLYGNGCIPYTNKKVNLVNSKGEIIKTATTNANGAFVFSKLPPEIEKSYKITVDDATIKFCKKSIITFRDRMNKVISTKNFGQ